MQSISLLVETEDGEEESEYLQPGPESEEVEETGLGPDTFPISGNLRKLGASCVDIVPDCESWPSDEQKYSKILFLSIIYFSRKERQFRTPPFSYQIIRQQMIYKIFLQFGLSAIALHRQISRFRLQKVFRRGV